MKPAGAVRLSVRVIGWGEPARQCAQHHRHLPAVAGGLVGLEVVRMDTRWPCAWGIVGRAVARVLDQAGWVEYLRGVVPDGAPPSCASALLGAAARWSRDRGSPIVTYTLGAEPGTSMRAAGWVCVGRTERKRRWTGAGRVRAERVGELAEPKRRWVAAWCVPAALARGWEVER